MYLLGLFVNTLTANNMSSFRNSENLIQMQLSKKQKNLSECLDLFLKSPSNFEHFEKKYDPDSLCISEIWTAKDVVRKGPLSEHCSTVNTIRSPKPC